MFRRIVEDYECRPLSVDVSLTGRAATAKAEHERFADGDERFKVRLWKLALADGTRLDVLLQGANVASMTVLKGRAEIIIEARRDGIVPRVKDGDRIVIAHEGTQLFEGTFRPD